MLLALSAAGTLAVSPNYKGCLSSTAKQQRYCDASLSVDDRLDAMFAHLNLSEKIAMISPQPDLGSDTCGDHTAGKDAIGLPDYFWLTEANSNVAALCYPGVKYACPTTFVGPLNMGASFNDTSWRLKGATLGTEMRAFNNLGWHRRNTENKIGLTGFGPNINLVRDPRFGRASELHHARKGRESRPPFVGRPQGGSSGGGVSRAGERWGAQRSAERRWPPLPASIPFAPPMHLLPPLHSVRHRCQ